MIIVQLTEREKIRRPGQAGYDLGDEKVCETTLDQYAHSPRGRYFLAHLVERLIAKGVLSLDDLQETLPGGVTLREVEDGPVVTMAGGPRV